MEGQPQARVVWRLEAADAPDTVTVHSFSPDRQRLAICPNSEEIIIFERRGSEEFHRAHTLTKHKQRVTGLDWSCEGRLLSCSEDRTAWVWELDGKDPPGWRPAKVELKAPRAALCAAWAPNGARFAVGLASRDTALCYFQELVNCWVALKVGKSKASVTTLAWHPTSQFLATGSMDRRYAVYDVNEANMPQTPEDLVTFSAQEELAEDAGAWVNSVVFSPNGRNLAVLAQDSTVRIKNLSAGKDSPVSLIRWRSLPFLCGTFINDKCLVVCGFDCVPVLIRAVAGQWEVHGIVDCAPAPTPAPAAGAEASGKEAFDAARNRFRDSARGRSSVSGEGTPGSAARSADAASIHTNTITACGPFGSSFFTTSGLDGQVLIWELTA